MLANWGDPCFMHAPQCQGGSEDTLGDWGGPLPSGSRLGRPQGRGSVRSLVDGGFRHVGWNSLRSTAPSPALDTGGQAASGTQHFAVTITASSMWAGSTAVTGGRRRAVSHCVMGTRRDNRRGRLARAR